MLNTGTLWSYGKEYDGKMHGGCVRILMNGDLMIALSDAQREKFKEEFEYGNYENQVYDMMKTIGLNVDEFVFMFDGGDAGVLGLTAAPAIMHGVMRPEGEELDTLMWAYNMYDLNESTVWYWPDYQVDSFVDQLLETGVVIFTHVDNKPADQLYRRRNMYGYLTKLRS